MFGYACDETKALMKMGLTHKGLSKDDRRMTALGLTQEGIDLLDSITVIDDITQIHRRAGGRVAFGSGPRCSFGKFERVEKVQEPAPASE